MSRVRVGLLVAVVVLGGVMAATGSVRSAVGAFAGLSCAILLWPERGSAAWPSKNADDYGKRR